jgi:hypothetical protein
VRAPDAGVWGILSCIKLKMSSLRQGLRKEGFQPFIACQTRVRADDKRAHTKHMVRLRHADQITGREANEIILLNSHDGSSSC